MFYPLDPMPNWLKWTARVNPITWQVDLFRYATIDLAEGEILLEMVGFCLFTAASFALATRALREQQ